MHATFGDVSIAKAFFLDRLLFSRLIQGQMESKNLNSCFCYLLAFSSTSLNIRTMLRCKLWRKSFLGCIAVCFVVAKTSLASRRSFFVNPMTLFNCLSRLNFLSYFFVKKNEIFLNVFQLSFLLFTENISVILTKKKNTNLSLKVL